MINPLSQLPLNRKTGQIPILPAPSKNGQEIKQEVLEDDEVDHDSVKVIHFEEDEGTEEKIIIPKMERPTGLGGVWSFAAKSFAATRFLRTP